MTEEEKKVKKAKKKKKKKKKKKEPQVKSVEQEIKVKPPSEALWETD